jgi:hypothetical protein
MGSSTLADDYSSAAPSEGSSAASTFESRSWASHRIRTTAHAKPRQGLKTNSLIVLLQTVTAYGTVAFVCTRILRYSQIAPAPRGGGRIWLGFDFHTPGN